MDPQHYSTVRVMAPTVPFFEPNSGHVLTGLSHKTGHRRASYHPVTAYQQPIMIPGHSAYLSHSGYVYSSGAHFSTVNPAKLKAVHHQQNLQTQSHSSPLNALFTWKRKSKTPSNQIASQGTQARHSSEYCPAYCHQNQSQPQVPVPASLARLFVQPNGKTSTVKVNSKIPETSKRCLCSGLTESTFMAPPMYYDEKQPISKDSVHKSSFLDQLTFKNRKDTAKSLKSTKSRNTIRAKSTDSLLENNILSTKPFCTVNEKKLNSAKSLEYFAASTHIPKQTVCTGNRRSILECNVNPYELVLDGEADKQSVRKKDKNKTKSATVAIKSSRKSHSKSVQQSVCSQVTRQPEKKESQSNLSSNSRGKKGIFNAANSIRIAGQSVYSSIKYEEPVFVDQSPQVNRTSNCQLQRSKSSGSLSSWSFSDCDPNSSDGSATERYNIDSSNKYQSTFIEPEPDYDLDDDVVENNISKTSSSSRQLLVSRSIERLDALSKSTSGSSTVENISKHANHKSLASVRSNGRRLSTIARPKVNPPPPPPSLPGTSSVPPPPPPPPPPSYLLTGQTITSSLSSTSTTCANSSDIPVTSQTKHSSNAHSKATSSSSYQNELKEKLNQGVKSILKKTNFSSTQSDADNGSGRDSTSGPTDVTSSGVYSSTAISSSTSDDTVENRIKEFEDLKASSLSKPKKHVHFRVKRHSTHHLNRSRSTSHIITETIHEEDDEHNYYDDVAVPLVTTRSVDDVTVVHPEDSLLNMEQSHSTCSIDSNNETNSTVDLSLESLSSYEQQQFHSPQMIEIEHNFGSSGDFDSSYGRVLSNPSLALSLDNDAYNVVNNSKAASICSHTTSIVIRNDVNKHNLKGNECEFSPSDASPTPPPVPARRTPSDQANAGRTNNEGNLISRTLRSYSSGSVRSLLAKKLNRSIGHGNTRSTGSKTNLSVLFSTRPSTDFSPQSEHTSNSATPYDLTTSYDDSNTTNFESSTKTSINLKSKSSQHLKSSNHADDHIYEELDSVYVDSFKAASHSVSTSGQLSRSSFFGSKISRDKILDYLQDARDRLERNTDEINDEANDFGQNREGHLENQENIDSCNSVSLDVDLNNDSGNSSLSFGEDYNDTLACFMAAKRMKSKSRHNSDNLKASSPATTNRRSRVSNVSNASSDSSATSGVSVSNLTLDDTEDDIVTTSSSSIGSNYYACGSGIMATVERNDSGVGTELLSGSKSMPLKSSTFHDLSETRTNSKESNSVSEDNCGGQQCVDCDSRTGKSIGALTDTNDSDVRYYFNFVCPCCEKRRNERKEIISEFVDTELKYGRDLRIILEEFARPISVAGLLTQQQVDEIFLNLDELIEVNCQFSERLQDAMDLAIEQGDEDLTTVSIGQLFHECLLAKISVFERYCVRQASASLLLNQLEKEKELLRIFLRVSQMENTLLRRMNLRSFLVVPVQRVTKYPLLLNRLHKVTPHHFCDRESLHEAQNKLEFHLENINQKTRGSIAVTTSRIWRRISNLSTTSIRSRSTLNDTCMDDFGYVRLKKTALELLKWPKDESRFVLIGKLSYIVEKSGTSSEQINQSSSYNSIAAFNSLSHSNSNISSAHNSTSKIWSRSLKFSTANAVLAARSHSPNNLYSGDYGMQFESANESNSELSHELTNYCGSSNDQFDSTNIQQQPNKASPPKRSNSRSPIRVNSLKLSRPNKTHSSDGNREAVLLLFKEKNGRYVLCREMLNLALCVVANATEVDSEEFFEIHELESRESLLLKAETHSEMKEWLEQLRIQSNGLGNWRRRRNALPNIMVLKNMDNHSPEDDEHC